MYNTKLTDFTYEELSFISVSMGEKIKDCQSKIEIIEKFDDSETKTDMLKYWQGELTMASLVSTQVMNAIVKVKMQDIAKSN